jgi:hypothetical protein
LCGGINVRTEMFYYLAVLKKKAFEKLLDVKDEENFG